MKKIKRNLSFLWLIFFGIFIFLSCCHFYLSILKIEVWEQSPKFQTLQLGNESILQPLLDLVKIYNSFSSVTNFFTGFGLLLAAFTALFSYKLEGAKILSKKFYVVLIIILLIILSFVLFIPPSKLNPCIGCENLVISVIGNKTIFHECFNFSDGTIGIIREYNLKNSTFFIVGKKNSKGERILFDQYKLKKEDECLFITNIQE